MTGAKIFQRDFLKGHALACWVVTQNFKAHFGSVAQITKALLFTLLRCVRKKFPLKTQPNSVDREEKEFLTQRRNVKNNS